jgi:phosphoribosyl-AMP cyclohydrolase
MKYKTKPKTYSKEQRVTYYKRKRGCLKKCIEMSTICDQDVFMVMLDKKTKMLIELNSTPEFDLKAVTLLLKN